MISVKNYTGALGRICVYAQEEKYCGFSVSSGEKGRTGGGESLFLSCAGSKKRAAFRLDLSGPGQRASGKLQLLFCG